MKTEHRVIALSAVLAAGLWGVDAYLDALALGHSEFSPALLVHADVTPHDFWLRIASVAGILTFGVFVARMLKGKHRGEHALRESEERLRQAQKMEAVGTLASGVAHDFSNLLTAIYGYIELARLALSWEHAAIEPLKMAEQACKQAGGVTRSLLMFSRKVEAHRQPLSLGTLIGETIDLLRHMLPASIEMIHEVSSEPPIWVYGDGSQLQQVLMNVAINARDSMPDGGHLRIALRHEPPAEIAQPVGQYGCAIIDVRDNGHGMPEEVRARVFEPFFTTKLRGQGTGLGMAIAHTVVTEHGGNIRVESAVGAGTRVIITLPCCAPPSEVPAQAWQKAGPASQGELILVVEDDDHVRAIMTSSLRSCGYAVLQACDGAQAAEAIAAHRDDVRLIALDIDLPRRSGLSCLEEMRKNGSNTPVIVTTGSVDFPLDDRPWGRTHVLRKPFQMGELTALIGRVLAECPDPAGEQT